MSEEGKISKSAKNHLVLIGIFVLIAMVAVVISVARLSSKSSSPSAVSPIVPMQGAQTQTTPAYVDALKERDKQQLANAETSGGSAIPSAVATASAAQDSTKQRPQNGNSMSDAHMTEIRNEEQAQYKSNVAEFSEAIAALKKQWRPDDPEIGQQVDFKQKKSVEKTSMQISPGQSASSVQASQSPSEMLIDKGKTCFAVLNSKINTDSPGMIMGTLTECSSHGHDLKGGVIYGNFTRTGEAVALTFNLLNVAGKGYTINAVAIDQDTASSVINGQVDNHVLVRYGLPFLTALVAGYGQAAAQANTFTTIGVGGVTTMQGALSSKQMLAAAVGKGAMAASQTLNTALQQDQNPTVTIDNHPGIGILFLANVNEK